ncbi:MAG: glycosyltransferase, partial [Candidatus Aminicenantes bacterium]|nr:glycosyltransferase [Candidatus Aminicenantes bacterium]
YSIWNPAEDKHIPAHYGPEDLAGKTVCKQALIKKLGLHGSGDSPLLGMITRLVEQKGVDLLIEIIPDLIESGCLLVILGSGDKPTEDKLEHLSHQYREQLYVHIGFDDMLAHEIEAGADIYLMPSRYEPCGLNQLYSLKYGTIPVVRATGGLDDTIREFNSREKTGNGFKFTAFSSKAFLAKIRQALKFYAKRSLWNHLIKNAMSEDHSWEHSARLYMDLYLGAAKQNRK